METLSEKQVDFIRRRIRHEGIEMEDLENDILDHLCCAVEREMAHTPDFEACVKKVFGDFASAGLGKIQYEINYILNETHFIMKKIVFIMSATALTFFFVSMLLTSIGLFGDQYRHYMEILAFLNQFAICFLVLPVYWIHQYSVMHRNHEGPVKLFLYLTGFLCSEMLVNALFFKIMHFPGGNLLFMIAAVLGIFYVPFYSYTKYKATFSDL